MPTIPGELVWTDLTVPDAGQVRDFYQSVVGWDPSPVAMDGYDDFAMNLPGTGHTVAGICHARGANSGLPAVWLPYFHVADLDASLATCAARGGKAVSRIRAQPGSGRYAVVQDPAGAMAALFEPEPG